MKTSNTLTLIIGLFWAFQATPIQAQSIALPETPVGKIATAFFEAFNVEDDSKMREFTSNYRTESALKRVPLESRMAQHNQIKGMIKSLSPRVIKSSSDQQLTVLVFAEAIGAWFETSFAMSETDPSKLEKFGLQPTSPPSDDSAFGDWASLEDLLENVVAKHEVPGISMAVIENGMIKEVAVAGLRQMGGSDPVQRNDRFHLGSITKSMTATLIGRLVEQGKLSAESTLKTLLPKMDMLPVYEKVTVRQLLDHMAGIAPYLTVTDEEEVELLALPGNATQQREAFAKMVLQQEPTSAPGTAFAYSNAGYAILGMITEKLSGEAWDKQLQNYLFKPLGMKTAGIDWPRTEQRPNEPAGHFGPKDQARVQGTDEYELGPYIEPAGDTHASMQDLAQYALAHMKGLQGKDGILNANTIQWLHQPAEGKSYAGGWFVTQSEEGVAVHEHGGSAGTFMAMMMIEPENNRGWVIAANAGGLTLDGIFREMIQAWRSK